MTDSLRTKSVLIAGAGNIGSHLAPLVARIGVGRMRIVDRDHVEAKNLATQDFRPPDVGRPKAEVIAERLRNVFPDVEFEGTCADLEDLPLGAAEVDVILGALDSRRARQVLISEIAWPLGVPVVDGGVGEGLLGRMQVFLPGPERACLECTWGQADYRQLAAEYPCQPGEAAQAPATVSTAFLGSCVASLMASECHRILGGDLPTESYEVPFDLGQHHMRHFVLRRSPRCRFDHEIVARRCPVEGETVGDLLAAIEAETTGPVRLECRRAIAKDRFLLPETLRARRGETLRSLGLTSGDRLRVRGLGVSVYLCPGKPSRGNGWA
jgi:molybdopterin/thiamine biosynthesis adenylyltransferase